VKQLQRYASQGIFMVEGVKKEVEEKLAGIVEGILDWKTQLHIEKALENGWKVPEEESSAKISDSVGAGGANKPEDVKLVKKRLKELGYPINNDSEILAQEDIKAINFFQALSKQIKMGLVSVDGRNDKGGKTEEALFGNNPVKYKSPVKGSEKLLEESIKNKKDNALAGTDESQKKAWENIMSVWKEVSPYLPEGTTMASGLRTKQEQREQLYNKYKTFQSEIEKNFGKNEYQKNINMSKYSTLSDDDKNNLDKTMYKQICQAKSSREVALPGTSKHEKGNAIDTQTSSIEQRVRCLLWYSIEFSEKNHVLNITAESNQCVHFEFKE